MRTFKVIILTTLLCLSTQTWAHESIIPECDKVTVAGDAQWVPYVIIEDQGISGVAMDMAAKLFGELDIPMKKVAFNNRLELLQALRNGDIDLVVSTYPNNDIAGETDLIKPAYIYDPITIAVKSKEISKVTNWEDIAGYHGVMDMTFAPDQETQEFFDNYLSVRDRQTLAEALDSVLDSQAYYIIGSELQLYYSIIANNLENDLQVASNVQRTGPVHMAFVKDSPCKQYAAYLTKRLQDYKNNGTVEKLVNAYK